jgi:uncharacterized protein (TIGR02118 family)
MAKIMFILQRKSGTTREECLEYWAGEHHTSIVRKLPGLTRWVQNHVISAPAEPAACDGVGELSFESEEVMQGALNSPEMSAAVEDARNFLDMDKTGLIIVEEKTVVARATPNRECDRSPATWPGAPTSVRSSPASRTRSRSASSRWRRTRRRSAAY